MKNYIVIICLSIYMLAGSFLGTVLPEALYGNCEQLNSSDAYYADSAQHWQISMTGYGTQKAWLEIITPILLLIIAAYRPTKLDVIDWCFGVIIAVSGSISVADWKLNGNTREIGMDTIVIGSILLILIIIKIGMYGIGTGRKIR
jgi:hypothetical protein